MPELPEVQVMVNQLAARLRGQKIRRLHVRDRKLRLPARRLAGRRIVNVRRRAKYIVVELDDGRRLLMHLRMTGWFEFSRPATYRLRLDTTAGSVWFVDSRRFGQVQWLSARAVEAQLAKLGPEPLTMLDDLAGLQHSNRPVKVSLLDQRVVAGVGNIYASEALWTARIHPARRAKRLHREERRALLRAVAKVLRRAIGWGDAIFANYSRLAVYDRAGKPCRRRCGGVVRRIVQQQRSTFYCPVCQST